ncbi:MAG: hypothetical protein ACYSU5_06305 [Planctomycetota bacterium]|jgi:hypothetical protein
MRKILISVTFIVTAIASLSLLTFVPSCVTYNDSSQIREKMTAVRQFFPSAIAIAEISISQGARVSGYPDGAKISEIKGDSGLLGYCVESTVVSRSGPFKIRTLLEMFVSVLSPANLTEKAPQTTSKSEKILTQ